MNKALHTLFFLLFISFLAMALGCKNIQKFKDSREELKTESKEVRKGRRTH